MNTQATPEPKRGPGRPRKTPALPLGIRINEPLRKRLWNHVAPHNRRPWLEALIERELREGK